MDKIIAKANAKLQAQKKAFSNSIKSIDYPATAAEAVGRATKPPPTTATATLSSEPLIQPPQQNIVHASGFSVSGQLYQIIDFLKRKECPQTVKQISDNTNIDLLANAQLLGLVKNNPKVTCINNDTFEYKPMHDIKNKNDLLQLLKRHYADGLGGLHVRELKDTWSGTMKAIEELEKSELIYVLRQKERPTVLFYNDMPDVSSKGRTEFKDLWRQVSIPDEADLERELKTAGLQVLPVKVDEKQRAAAAEAAASSKKRKPRKTRQIRITNTHLNFDLTVDYQKK